MFSTCALPAILTLGISIAVLSTMSKLLIRSYFVNAISVMSVAPNPTLLLASIIRAGSILECVT